MKTYTATWTQMAYEVDAYGDETDRYMVGKSDTCQAENEDAAYKIFCERHPIPEEYGFDDIVESNIEG